MTASTLFLSSWTYLLLSSELIHFDLPVTVAIFPSRLIAAFNITNGLFLVLYLMNASFIFLASFSIIPQSHLIPALLSSSKPFPFTLGLGSLIDATTLLMPALIISCVQ